MLDGGASAVSSAGGQEDVGINITTAATAATARTAAQDALSDDVAEIPPTQPRPLYFAYGSNLSYSQMRQRCEHDPEKSGKPLAVARLDRWRWLICERGYANVIPPEELRVGQQESEGEKVPVSGEEDAVFGILYDMTPEDEYLLDFYEGVDHNAPAAPLHSKVDRKIRPREQGSGDYNKWYVPATVTKWLTDDADDDDQEGLLLKNEKTITVLVYVDEEHVRVGPPKTEYIARMNRAIRESVELGLPRDWVDSVMRKFIPEV
ncbi:hypothetical protein VTN77DRAFT_8558 [Rasamsonia byssochlamydoides]|uniref:uncharacterized protein n=1 Tax=Rasamsonia byssochlamydoides TaxID=89139 RepID=UPI003742554A